MAQVLDSHVHCACTAYLNKNLLPKSGTIWCYKCTQQKLMYTYFECFLGERERERDLERGDRDLERGDLERELLL